MSEHMKQAVVFLAALMLAAPVVQVSVEQDALAGPFDTLSSSRKGGARTHKQKSKKDKKVESRKSSKSKKSTTSSRRTTTTSSRGRTTTSRTTTSTRRPVGRTTTTTRRRVDDRRVVRCTSRGRCDNDPVAVGTTRRRPVSTTTSRTTTTTRRPVGRTTTTRTTTTRRPTTTRRTTTTTRRRPTTTRRNVHHHHHTSSSTHVTEVHHYHNTNTTTSNSRYYGRRTSSAGVATTNRAPSRGASAVNSNPRELYITGGVGLSGLAANQIADGALPGLDFNVGIGSKRRLIAGELGFGLSGYRFDPDQAENTADLTLVSVTGDLKLQPKLAFIEPYVSAGLGGHVLNDHIIAEGAAGASLRLGAGVDLRFDNVAVSAQYQRNFMGLVGDDLIYEDGALSATTETLSAGLKIYF